MSEQPQQQNQEQKIDFTVNTKELYHEENITDLKVASIKRMIPIKPDGTKDESRTAQFYGYSQLVSPQGPIPIQAPLPANNLQEAIDIFPDIMQKALDEMLEKARQMQEQKKKQQEEKKQEEKKE